MAYSEKQQIEQTCFNQIVHQKWDGKSLWVDAERPPFATYNGDLLDGAKKFLGQVSGQKILEIGCGNGELTVWLAKLGAEVFGVDISDESIKIAELRSTQNQTSGQTHFYAQPAEQLPFENNYFDLVFINVTLHHLDIELALQEFLRVLKVGGRLVAVEPLVFSKTIQNFRTSKLFTKLYPIRQETPTERILLAEDLNLISKYFSQPQVVPVRVFSPLIFKIQPLFLFLANCFFKTEADMETRKQKMIRRLQAWDEILLNKLPALKFLSRYVVIAATKEAAVPKPVVATDDGQHLWGHPIGLVLVVVYKGIWGAIEFLAGLFLILSSKLIPTELVEDPQDLTLNWLINNFHPSFKLVLGLGAVISLLGLFKIILALGIWYRSYAIRNLGLVIMSLFAIFAVYTLLIKFSGFKVAALLVDLLIIFYFWKILPKHFHQGRVE